MDYMEQALTLAGLALGQVSPNPAVGAVVVKDGVVVGKGHTQPPGGDHAEVVALKQAGTQAKDGVIYVTLEPCNIYGRTPPCTKAIIKAGIKEVNIAMIDDNPQVNGDGIKELRDAGIEVKLGEGVKETRRLNEAYIHYKKTGKPFVIAKYAISLDGKIATKKGDSKWISSQDSRCSSHQLRHISDVIMVGVNTVLADDPQLTVRGGHGKGGNAEKQPLRIIVDSRGRTPLEANVFHEPGKTIIAVANKITEKKKKAYRDVGAEVLEIPATDGRVDLTKLLDYLGEKSVTSILVEGGGILLGSLFDLKLVDKVIAYIAPMIIGGEEAKSPVAGEGFATIAEAVKLKDLSVNTCDDDVIITGYPVKADV
jgi:diaminohydroxyphosphoribosylaminopyrimidine deaminase/5-amino-6-(5-phosphoribosylamino)uracil reductase